MKLFIIYNLAWLISLIIWFAIIYMLRDKYKLHEKQPLISIPFNIFHRLFDIFDIIYNYHLSFLFLQLPKKLNETISDRLRRYHNQTVFFNYRIPLDFYRYITSLPFVKIINFFDRGHIMKDFDYWLKLYKEDSKRFEHEKTALIESEINKANPQNQLKLKPLQAKINRIRRTSKNPMNSLIIINNMMLLEFDNLRKLL